MPRLARLSLPLLLLAFCLVVGGAADDAMNSRQANALKQWFETAPDQRRALDRMNLPNQLSHAQAETLAKQVWSFYREGAEARSLLEEFGDLPPTMQELVERSENRRINIEPRTVQVDEHVMPFTIIRRETRPVPESGRALFICMHGGGAHGPAQGPHAWPVNTREWQTQTQLAITRYPAEGLFFVPRMADDRLGRWWHRHNQVAFEKLIHHAIIHWGVDPNRIYILGISEGGYGTHILAPFMPDRFAGANAMAAGVGLGNPPENLRNLPLRTDVGENDTMFERAPLAIAYHQRLDELKKDDANGYTHSINVQPGRGHGIDYRPGVAWIAQHTRNAYPEKIVWISRPLHNQRREHYYWIGLQGDNLDGNIRIVAEVDANENTVHVTAEQLHYEGGGGYETHATRGTLADTTPLKNATLRIMLNDRMLDLDKPVKIICNDKVVHEGLVHRNAKDLVETLLERGDPTYMFPVVVTCELK